jgi:hypothetical protein
MLWFDDAPIVRKRGQIKLKMRTKHDPGAAIITDD